MKKLLFSVLFASMAFGANTAKADGWPVSVVGNWSMWTNQSGTTLSITAQSIGDCQQLTGSIYGSPIVGYYCPYSGRIHFLNIGATWSQDYNGNVSQVGSTLQMGGIYSNDLGSNSFPVGEYSF